ncbi:Signal transduction response regulator, receiver domain [Moorella glycerini]|uniref:Stage 0 sporulation protein A homolog n=2 Tax=Neomoorella TaxID=44260 RepID=A0A9X7J2P0_9FIRM|nr:MULTISPECIES: response regulator transcription factor [Moorella]KYH33841.1 alkaline phosphatase synthesis transcriptional regulatory protein PhoP [Moorella mulderi DSM 14980]PRR72677.1 Alkaline phosphatase synthesis transcriptional regulatory protein PhoP [Moorella stamsii]CEP68193.1 Signal transduction response regulator, receiver domain [Moorella glycerini]
MALPKVLIVDDEPAILELVSFNLQQAGFTTVTASDGAEALQKAAAEKPDLIILDVMLPRVDGFEVCRSLRARGNTPILMLTARREEVDRVLGLELGADDYLTKPFSPRELVARVRAILRRAAENQRQPDDILAIGDVVINPASHVVTVKGKPVDLTLKEYQLLQLLAENRGRVFSREALLERLWEGEYYGDTRTIDVHIRHLREKIEENPSNPRYILTVRGVGYKFRD